MKEIDAIMERMTIQHMNRTGCTLEQACTAAGEWIVANYPRIALASVGVIA